MATASSSLGSRGVALGVAVACTAQFLIGVDGLAVAIALPTVQRDLALAAIDAQWVLTAFGLAFGGSLLLGGRLGDLYGRRRLLSLGMALFACGSAVAGLAPGLVVLVPGRMLQGLGAAAAVPAALALIGSLVPSGPARTRALALMAAMTSVGVMTGLLVGGVLTQLLGWRSVFLVMVPVAAVAALAVPRVLPEARADEPLAPDVAGALLVTGGLMAIIFGATRLEHAGAAAVVTVVPLLVGAALLAGFVAWERRTRSPLVRFEMLGVRSLRSATLGVGINAITFTSIVYVGTLYLQGPLDYSPIEAGLAVLPLDAVAFVVPLLAAGAVARRSPRALLAGCFALSALGLLSLARTPTPATFWTDLLPPLVLLGASMSIAFVVLTHEAVAEVDPDDKGVASGIFETSNHLFGGAIGVALYATVLAASDYRAAFLTAAALAAVGVTLALLARGRPHAAEPLA
jgi:MFS family permease